MKNIVKRLEGKELTAENLLSVMTLEEKLGQMFMLDFRRWKNREDSAQSDHQNFSPEVKELIGKYGLGNVILFAENFADINQIVKFNHELKNSVVNGIPMLIGVDQEGGRVVRTNDGCSMPGNMGIGATADEENAYTNGYIIGKELKAVGINCDFAPVLDVNNNPANPSCNLRSFSSDHKYAAKYGVKMAEYSHELTEAQYLLLGSIYYECDSSKKAESLLKKVTGKSDSQRKYTIFRQ